MVDPYIVDLEIENEELRLRIKTAEDEAERVWELLDTVKNKILNSTVTSIKTNFDSRNVDASGQIVMMNRKNLKEQIAQMDAVESFYKELVKLIQE